jgi:hypothetical protein
MLWRSSVYAGGGGSCISYFEARDCVERQKFCSEFAMILT